MGKIKIFDLVLIAIFSAIIFVSEYILQMLPNIQITVFLIILFSKHLGFVRTFFIVLIYVFLDTCFMGGFNFIYFPFMLFGWLAIPTTLNLCFKKSNDPLVLALLGILFSFIYSWIMIIPGVFVTHINFIDYLLADIIFEIILAVSSFLTTLWLYKPMSNSLEKLLLIKDRID